MSDEKLLPCWCGSTDLIRRAGFSNVRLAVIECNDCGLSSPRESWSGYPRPSADAAALADEMMEKSPDWADDPDFASTSIGVECATIRDWAKRIRALGVADRGAVNPNISEDGHCPKCGEIYWTEREIEKANERAEKLAPFFDIQGAAEPDAGTCGECKSVTGRCDACIGLPELSEYEIEIARLQTKFDEARADLENAKKDIRRSNDLAIDCNTRTHRHKDERDKARARVEELEETIRDWSEGGWNQAANEMLSDQLAAARGRIKELEALGDSECAECREYITYHRILGERKA